MTHQPIKYYVFKLKSSRIIDCINLHKSVTSHSWQKYFVMRYQYIINLFDICRDNERKADDWIFYKSKGHTSVKNCSMVPKIEVLHRNILMINLHTKFNFSMCNTSE